MSGIYPKWVSPDATGTQSYAKKNIFPDWIGNLDATLKMASAHHAHLSGLLEIVVHYTLAINDGTNVHYVDAVVLTQRHQLASQDADHAQTTTSISIFQRHQLVSDDTHHDHTAIGDVKLVEHFTLSSDSAWHGHTADNLVLLIALIMHNAWHKHRGRHARTIGTDRTQDFDFIVLPPLWDITFTNLGVSADVIEDALTADVLDNGWDIDFIDDRLTVTILAA